MSSPNPDALLAQIQQSEPSQQKTGKLKIFFGMCPGVGKTYAMLKHGLQQKEEGTDVVVGIVETHGRKETLELAEQFSQISRKTIEYRESKFQEFDLDATLARHPQLSLVDELAHTNIPGSRHTKRYQDVLELLDAGISVYTTLNVQHIESRIDVIRQMMGVSIYETVPDNFLSRADEIELIDLSPQQLLKRLSEGKVYLGERAATAAEHFFKEGNLTALREMALRFAAEHVDQDLRNFLRTHHIEGPWKSTERLMVAVSASPYSESLIRWTKRMAGVQDSSWFAVYVESDRELSYEEKERLSRNMSLVRQLGGEIVTVSGERVEDALVQAAQQQNATQIIVGKYEGAWWKVMLSGGTLADKLIRKSGNVDIYVVRPEERAQNLVLPHPKKSINARQWWFTFFILAVTSGLGCVILPYTDYWAVSLLYLGAVVVAAKFLSRAPVLALAAASAIFWNYFFVPPRFSFTISRWSDALMCLMLFAIAAFVGNLTSAIRRKEALEAKRQKQIENLLHFIKGIAFPTDFNEGIVSALRLLEKFYKIQTAILVEDNNRVLPKETYAGSSFTVDDKEFSVATWAFQHRQSAGRFTDTLSEIPTLMLPLFTQIRTYGVLAVRAQHEQYLNIEEREQLETFTAYLAMLLERYHLLFAIQHAEMLEKSQRLQKTLFDCISHELKTPLAVIHSAHEQLESADVAKSKMLYQEIGLASKRLQRIVDQLLDAARLESGMITPKLEWCDIEEAIQSAVHQNAIPLECVQINIAPNMPMIRIDQALMETCLSNLIYNATQHHSTQLKIDASFCENKFILKVRDQGHGIPEESLPKIFDKFYRAPQSPTGGTGLGLSIVQGFVKAHGGTVTARNHPQGGAEFTIEIPTEALAA